MLLLGLTNAWKFIATVMPLLKLLLTMGNNVQLAGGLFIRGSKFVGVSLFLFSRLVKNDGEFGLFPTQNGEMDFHMNFIE
jgi:hypothetical protein